MRGRSKEDVEAFYADYSLNGAEEGAPKMIIVGDDSLCMSRIPSNETSIKPADTRAHFFLNRSIFGEQMNWSQLLGEFKAVASWAGCSGSVIMMATPTNVIAKGLYTCMVGSATETDPSRQRPGLQDPYNRPGELVGIQLDSTSLKGRVLDGHRTVQSDGRILRSTVSCLVHSENNSAFIAGGYDGNVTAWSDDGFKLLARFTHSTNAPTKINALVSDPRSYGLMYGTSRGELVWCADPLAGDSSTPSISILSKSKTIPGQSDPLANAIDILAITNGQRAPQVVYAGHGYLSGHRCGTVVPYDLSTLQPIDNTIKVGQDKCLTDISLHPHEQLLAVSTGILIDDKASAGDGILRLFDTRTFRQAFTIGTSQNDIHRLSFSPCGDLLYSNDSSSGLMLIHDMRYPNRPIWSTNHSWQNSSDEHYLGFAWLPSNLSGVPSGLLMTGGNDSIVRLWDPKRPDPLLQSIELDRPINNIVISTDSVHAWIGMDHGAVHLLSRNHSLADTVGRNMLISQDPLAL